MEASFFITSSQEENFLLYAALFQLTIIIDHAVTKISGPVLYSTCIRARRTEQELRIAKRRTTGPTAI